VYECDECGNLNDESAQFCANCGSRLEFPTTNTDEYLEEREVGYDAESEADFITMEEGINQLLSSQRQQRLILDEVHKKVGCLHIYLIVSIVIGIIVAIMQLILGV
jgi:hypothetical protein